ncbi:MAG: hypothetical protein QM602_02400 [Microbacterium sp.]
MDEDRIARNLAAQRTLYGEPLGDLMRRAMGPLQLSQAALARALGLSAPMLSQLMQAQRVKIGNPAVVQRLEAVIRLADEVSSGAVPPEEVEARLATASETTGVLTGADEALHPHVEALRAFVSVPGESVPGEDARRAAALLAEAHPVLAERLHAAASGDERRLTRLLAELMASRGR